MLGRMLKKFWKVQQKNLNRIRARQAIRRGMFRGIDEQAMEALRKNFDGHPCIKYQDKFYHSLVRNAERVFALGLHKSTGLRILDLGCGFGYFLHGTRFFGHHPVGLDLEDPYLGQVTRLLGLTKVEHRIVAFQPLPEIPGGPFDLVTAFATMFDSAGFEGQWGLKEWTYFLRDLRRFMAPGCRAYFKFNQYVGPGTRSGIGCQAVTTELWDYFHSLGGTFDKRAMSLEDAPTRIDRVAPA